MAMWGRNAVLQSALAVVATATYFAGAPAAYAADPPAPTTKVADAADTTTDFLSDDAWRALPREERRIRSRRSMIARYEPEGASPSVEKLAQYVDKFAALTVYDSRYYLYKVKATHVAGTTGSVVLSGEVYPAHYKQGIQDALQSLGFNVTENNIRTLPVQSNSYGISTTAAATLRREPRRNAEQLDSVGMGGSIRFLRPGETSDVTSTGPGGRHAPGAATLPEDKPEDWSMAQTMEGYIGFVRNADFEQTGDYQLPDGILKAPAMLKDAETSVPSGVFVSGSPEKGWRLHDGTEISKDAQVTDLRPKFTAEQIEALMKPFMGTKYVWGGVTDQGIDCSGFSQFFMRSEGVLIPRDAVQQATGGLIVAWGSEQVMKLAKPGDLLFFAGDNGRISHVAISLGGKRIIHSAGQGVHITELDEPRDEGADEAYGGRVIFARRMFTGR